MTGSVVWTCVDLMTLRVSSCCSKCKQHIFPEVFFLQMCCKYSAFKGLTDMIFWSHSTQLLPHNSVHLQYPGSAVLQGLSKSAVGYKEIAVCLFVCFAIKGENLILVYLILVGQTGRKEVLVIWWVWFTVLAPVFFLNVYCCAVALILN